MRRDSRGGNIKYRVTTKLTIEPTMEKEELEGSSATSSSLLFISWSQTRRSSENVFMSTEGQYLYRIMRLIIHSRAVCCTPGLYHCIHVLPKGVTKWRPGSPCDHQGLNDTAGDEANWVFILILWSWIVTESHFVLAGTHSIQRAHQFEQWPREAQPKNTIIICETYGGE